MAMTSGWSRALGWRSWQWWCSVGQTDATGVDEEQQSSSSGVEDHSFRSPSMGSSGSWLRAENGGSWWCGGIQHCCWPPSPSMTNHPITFTFAHNYEIYSILHVLHSAFFHGIRSSVAYWYAPGHHGWEHLPMVSTMCLLYFTWMNILFGECFGIMASKSPTKDQLNHHRWMVIRCYSVLRDPMG